MAVAGRSVPNVPIVLRGSLEDPADFGSRTRVIVVAAQPPRQAQQRITILRSTLQDPPVLTAAPPVTVAAQPDRRRFTGIALVLAAPQAQAATPATATPGPLVISSQPPRPQAAQALVTRNTLQDPPVLITAAPWVKAAQADRKWFATRAPLVLSAPVPPPAPAVSQGLLIALGV
jgi:hypothetical protein